MFLNEIQMQIKVVEEINKTFELCTFKLCTHVQKWFMEAT